MATIDCRKKSDGTVQWRVRIRRNGVRESASFSRRAAAEHWAREVEGAIDRGDWRLSNSAGELSFRQLLARYLAASDLRPGSRSQLDWWRGQLADRSLSTLTRSQILQTRSRLQRELSNRGKPRSSATVNRYMAALSGMFTWAQRAGYVAAHPVRGIDPLTEPGSAVRFLSEAERARLLEACRGSGSLRLEVLVVLALTTGARRGELLRLCWSDLDLRSQQVTFTGGNGRRARILPLAGPSRKLLVELGKVKRIDTDEVFVNGRGRVVFPRRAWEAALSDAGLDGFQFRDLRHSAASYLAMSGASLAEIGEILGYRTLKAVQRYAHLIEGQSSSAAARMHQRMFDGEDSV